MKKMLMADFYSGACEAQQLLSGQYIKVSGFNDAHTKGKWNYMLESNKMAVLGKGFLETLGASGA